MQSPQTNFSTATPAARTQELNLPIGKLIKDRVQSLGICKAELARRLNMSPANIHKIFKRTTIEVTLLYRISLALHYDFLALYRAGVMKHIQLGKYSMDDRLRHLQSMDRRIDLITELLKDLSREDPRHQTASREVEPGRTPGTGSAHSNGWARDAIDVFDKL